MLEAILAETAQRAGRVVDFADEAHRPARDHARRIVDQVVPDGRARRTEVIAFTDTAERRLQEVLRLNDIAAARRELDALLGELLPLSARMAELNANANAARAAIQLDLAQLDKERADLRVRVSVLGRQAAEAAQKARSRAARSAWTWLAGPLGKAIDELVGLIQDGGSTEATAKRATEDLKRAQAEIAQLERASQSLSLLAGSASGLTEGVQGLANGVAIMLGHAQNAHDDLRDAAHVKLFCVTAIRDLDDLRQDAA